VLVTVSDKKTQVDDGTYTFNTVSGYTKVNSTPDGKVDYYTADVITAGDLYPFGMSMPGRKYTANASAKYPFSINGQLKETDLNDNITTAMYWEYDSRIGRRWNVDPIFNISESPYACFANNPIVNTDIFGDDPGKKKKKPAENKDDALTVKAYEIVKKHYDSKDKGKDIRNELSNEITDFLKSTTDKKGNNKYFRNAGEAANFTKLVLGLWEDAYFEDYLTNQPYKATFAQKISEANSTADKSFIIAERSKILRNDVVGFNLIWQGVFDYFLDMTFYVAGGDAATSKVARIRSFGIKGSGNPAYTVATDALMEGTNIPKSFVMNVGGKNGAGFWVAPNATKHMFEEAVFWNKTRPWLSNLNKDLAMRSFANAVKNISSQGAPIINKVYTQSGWELIFSAGRKVGDLPVIKHALRL
jgi:hypothetical protein